MIDSMDGTGTPIPGPECPYVQLARLREFIRNGVEYGYIKVPDYPDPARDTIDAIINPGAVEGDES
jgi:hypothetical protein